MTIPTNFYTQQPSLLPQGLQSLMSSGQLAPSANPTMPQQPPGNSSAPPFGGGMQMMPVNWNQAAQQAAPIYQAPPTPAPPPQQILPPQPQMPWGASRGGLLHSYSNGFNRMSVQ